MEIIEKIKLSNFRNLSEQIVTFDDNVNCVFGNNGNGKTNLLEGIYFSIYKKSFRKKATFQQLLSVECGKPEIISNILLKNKDDKEYYSIIYQENAVKCFKDGNVKTSKPKANCVFVSPFDSFNFHNEAGFRRGLIDTLISNISESYKLILRDYLKLLKQKNFLLKTTQNYQQLDAVDSVLSEKIEYLVEKRQKFICEINPYLENIYKLIFNENICLKLEINSSFSNLNKEEILILLQNNRKLDVQYRVSKLGPHKDDLHLNFNGLNSVDFCSLGQQKTAYLSLLFAYINLFRYKFREYPIVLIDDVSGELDSIRLDLLIKYLFKVNYQVILTTANIEFRNRLNSYGNVKLIKVEDGYFQ